MGCCWCAGSSPGLGSGSPGVTSWHPSMGVHRGLALMALVHLSTAGGLRVPLQLLFSPLGSCVTPEVLEAPSAACPGLCMLAGGLDRGVQQLGGGNRDGNGQRAPFVPRFGAGFGCSAGTACSQGRFEALEGSRAPLQHRCRDAGLVREPLRGAGGSPNPAQGEHPQILPSGGGSIPAQLLLPVPSLHLWGCSAPARLPQPPFFWGWIWADGTHGACCGAGADPTAGLSISHLAVAVLRGSGGG